MDEQENKSQVKYVLFLLILIVITLVGVLIYLLIKPRMATDQLETNENITTVRQEDAPADDATMPSTQLNLDNTGDQTDTQQTQEQPAVDSTGQYNSEIDQDVNSLDSLDLSSPENDLGDDKIDEL